MPNITGATVDAPQGFAKHWRCYGHKTLKGEAQIGAKDIEMFVVNAAARVNYATITASPVIIVYYAMLCTLRLVLEELRAAALL